ncbi:MAG: hypothetical protein XD74_1515 [Actinobacteria bacterium 66_15]|nr:MAG: hypothetical protein XD74_1515 [Actinobacteria bacterium 66_15]
MSRFTASGARRSGDAYQDLQSAEVLLEWLEQPDAYRWVRLETMEGSLDDIQAERADGTRRLLQVKFSTDPLDEWGWADLTHREAGRRGLKPSLLQKWKASVDGLLAEGVAIGEAAFITNRQAAPDIRAHLTVDGLVDISGLPEPDRQQLVDHLGGLTEAQAFFGSFHFLFQRSSPEALEDALLRRFHALGGAAPGWSSLLAKIQRWINHQHEPSSDGTISLADVQTAALWNLPPQIPQGFLVPDDYIVPARWSQQVVEPLIRGRSDGVVVVTGSPGVGKSTYLSWLVSSLREGDVPVVRHHYFISPTDSTLGRTGWETAANSLIGQLRSSYGELVTGVGGHNPVPESLGEHLEAAGQQRSGHDPLVVVVDGLDHVWRDTGSEEDLRRLFDLLLPAPPGVVVLVGTQDVDMARIPRKVKAACPRDLWLEVPVLDLAGVEEWLRCHQGDLLLPDDEALADNLLQQLVDAFVEVSGGHPLVLHYTLAAASTRGVLPDAYAVRALPRFDTRSNIAAYYQTLWDDIGVEGHQLLHLLAEFDWSWPRDGLVSCLSPQGDTARLELAERAIRHVLGLSPSGVTVFHDSLRAFIRLVPTHQDAANSLRATVVGWLSCAAPEYWRWRYEWVERAKGGETDPLIASPDTEWCVSSLVDGRGLGEIAQVVTASAWEALRQGRLGEATERVYLDSSLSEAGHSDDVLPRLLWLALHARDARQLDLELELLQANADRTSVADIETVVEMAFIGGRRDICYELLDECGERWNDAMRDTIRSRDAFSALGHALPLLVAAALSSSDAVSRYMRYVDEHGSDPAWCSGGQYARALALLCSVGDDTAAVRAELRKLASREYPASPHAVDEIVRLAWREGFDPESWLTGAPGISSALARCDRLLVRADGDSRAGALKEVIFPSMPTVAYTSDENRFVDAARAYFFHCLASAAEGTAMPDATNVDVLAGEVSSFLRTLGGIACDAITARSSGASLGGGWLLTRLEEVEPPDVRLNDSHNSLARRHVVTRIVIAIAQDLEDLLHAEDGTQSLALGVLQTSIDGPWTTAWAWIEERVSRRRTMGDPESAQLLFDLERDRLAGARDDLQTRAREYATLAQFGLLHGISSGESRELGRVAARNLIGHGYHKDSTLFDVLAAIEGFEDAKDANLSRLSTISPVVQVVDQITDGDETRYLPERLAAVAWKVAPESVPPFVRALQCADEHWSVQSFFTRMAESLSLRDDFEHALARTLVHDEALAALDRRASDGDAAAAAVLGDTLAHFGRRDSVPQAGDGAHAEAVGPDKTSSPAPSDYPPDRLPEFASAVRDAHIYRDDPFADWFSHWRPIDPDGVLDALTAYREAQGSPLDRSSLREVIELAAERNGLAAAWDWLVTYHDAIYGWGSGWGAPSEVRWIWEYLRSRFPDRWLEFIIETARPRWRENGAPIWNLDRMTHFLTVVGERAQAEQVLDAGVRWGGGLAANMILPDAALTPDEGGPPPPLQLLVDRLDCPSRAVQERAGWWLAALLAETDTRDATALALRRWNGREQLELRTCVVLLVLHLALHAQGVPVSQCLELVTEMDLIPSVGVELLLGEFGEAGVGRTAVLDTVGRHSGSPRADFAGIDGFSTIVSGYLAPIFHRFALELDKGGIPFTRQWQWEAQQLAEETGRPLPRPEYFDSFYRGGVDGPALAVSDRVSTLLRSAYLRALGFFRLRMPLPVVQRHVRRVAAMADPSTWAVRPSSRPGWWPSDPGDAGGLDLLAHEVGQAVATGLDQWHKAGDEVLAYAAGPVRVRSRAHAELEVRGFLQAAYGATAPSAEDIASSSSPGCLLNPPRLSLPGGYSGFEDAADYVGDWAVAPLAWFLLSETQDWLLPERQMRGVHLPALWLFPEEHVMVRTGPQQVAVMLGEEQVARYEYWNDDVHERTHLGAFSRVGAALLMKRKWLDAYLEEGATLCWTATLSMSERQQYKERFGRPQVVGTWLLGGSSIVRATEWSPPM